MSDGVVNLSNFKGLKIVYILKEVNDKNRKKDGDLRDYLAEGGRRQTWNNIALWTYGLKNLKINYYWKDLEVKLNEPDFRKDQLQQICAFNIKKTPGHNKSNSNVIEKYGKEDREFIRKQFDIYSDCNLFICCGTPIAPIMRKYIVEERFDEWDITKKGIRYKTLGENKHLIWYSHPEARVDNNILYYGLIDSVREILKIIH